MIDGPWCSGTPGIIEALSGTNQTGYQAAVAAYGNGFRRPRLLLPLPIFREGE